MRAEPFTFYEFFAGGGMARAGLGPGWRCLLANDVDERKAEVYCDNWGPDDLRVGDVSGLTAVGLPRSGVGGAVDLAWASSPCQDLSVAGRRGGLDGARSSAFWGFWRLIEALQREDRPPRAVVIENVAGLLTSHGAADFAAVCGALDEAGYAFGALEVDAAAFLPQSRPRLFIVGLRAPGPGLTAPAAPFHTRRVVAAVRSLPPALASRARWWSLPQPPVRNADLASVLEADVKVVWHTPAHGARLLSLLSPLQVARVEAAQGAGERRVGALYRRTRIEDGARVQRAEVRFDGLAGCLRTPGGGSSRQFVVVAEDGAVRTRTLTPREGARLMGLPDDYRLPAVPTAALHVVGDGVAVPVVRWLADALIEPALAAGRAHPLAARMLAAPLLAAE